MPPIVVLAAAGWSALLETRARMIGAVLLALGLAEPLLFQVRNHPNQIIYFTPLMGGPQAAFARYDMDYWGNSVLQAVEWTDRLARESGVPLVVSGNPIQAVDANAARFKSLQVVARANLVYHLDIRLMRGPSQSLREFAARPDILYAVRMADGTPLCVVLPGPAFLSVSDRLKLTPGRIRDMADGIRAIADLRDPVGEVIAEWKKQPGAVGVRIIMTTREAGLRPDDPGIDRIAREAARHGFPVNVLFWGNVDAGTTLIDRHPNTRFIVDHMGILQPRERPAPPQPWADLPKVLALAKRPNALIKISGACTLSREPYPFADIWDPLARVFDAWGFERCLWGTDWTRAFAVVNYEHAVEPFRQTSRLSASDRAMLMGGACAKAYGWSPKKA